jgi:hypothetical protein
MSRHDPTEPQLAATAHSTDTEHAYRRYEGGDPFWLADDETAGPTRRALVACAVELGHAPAPNEYQRWRRRRQRRGETHPTLSVIAAVVYPGCGWNGALYDAGVTAEAPVSAEREPRP